MLNGGSANARSTDPAGNAAMPEMQSPFTMRLVTGGFISGEHPGRSGAVEQQADRYYSLPNREFVVTLGYGAEIDGSQIGGRTGMVSLKRSLPVGPV
jgi:hypothetical protein